MKKIPFKNYIKVFLLFVVTIIGCLILVNNYNDKKSYERENKHIKNFISNIKYDELKNYLTENHEGYIYIASITDNSLEDFEVELKNFIVIEELERSFVYLDSSSLDSSEYQKIENYFSDSLKSRKVKVPVCANIFVVRDGKIVDILFKTNENITLEDVQNFIRKHQVEV